jgi:hypothetical protein
MPPTAATPVPPFQSAAIPLAFAAASSEAMAEGMRASLEAWSVMARSCTEAGRAYAELLGQAMTLDWPQRVTAARGADALLTSELAASEAATERLLSVAEDTLTATVGRCVPLPD